MLIDYKGPTIGIVIDANEAKSKYVNITLKEGYSYEQIKILSLSNVAEIVTYCKASINTSIKYPPVNSKSPCVLNILVIDPTKTAVCAITIEKFGQISDPDYFTKAFDPILVTGDDGNKYKVIPSDQFK